MIVWLLQAFSPESFEYCITDGRSSGLLYFCGLPILNTFRTVACGAKILQSLQLRVQLRILTGFPLDTENSITIPAAKVSQKRFQE